MSRYARELETAVMAARRAAAIYHNCESETETKGNEMGAYDIVTDNDIKAERSILSTISDAFPDDSFLCEESGEDIRSDRVWTVDPIDGTVNYARGLNAYGTQIALMEGDETIVSAIYVPYDDLMICAEKGCGTTVNGRRVDIKERRPMDECILSINDYTKRSKEFRRMHIDLVNVLCEKVGRMRMYGCACYDFAMLATGGIDYHTRFLHHPWDHVPGMLICTEAGAIFDEDLFRKRELLMLARSEENLSEIVNAVDDGMSW